MKRLLVLLLTTALATVAAAQRTVSGKVIEDDTREAVVQATVALVEGEERVVANGVTNADGLFAVKAPRSGTYTLKVTFVGFKTYTKKVSIAADKDVRLGTIAIAPDAIMLKGATVTGQAAKVTLKADTFVYNASAYRTPEGSVVEELVKRLPGAQVDDDGKVTINGKEVKKIMVDGKEFMTGDTKTAMKNLPTSIIERVKAYDQKSDFARVSGIDDGEEETVLDFGIKRGMNKGTMLNADLAAGTQSRYSGRLFGGWMKDDLKLFLMTSANNVNDMGFSSGGGGRWGGGRQGLTATKMTGLNLNYEKKGRLKLDGSIRWNHSDGDAVVRRSTEDFMSSTESTFGNSLSKDMTRTNSWDARMRLEWMPDTMWNVMFRPQFRYNSSDALGSGVSATFSADPYALSGIVSPLDQLGRLSQTDSIVKNSNQENSLSYSDTKTVGGTLQINRKLSSGGRNLTLRLVGNYSEGISRSVSNSLISYYQVNYDSLLHRYVQTDDTTSRYAVTPTKNWDYSIRATYSEPIMPRTYLQFSYQFQYKYTMSDRATYDLMQTGLDMIGVTPGYRGWDSYLSLLSAHQPPFALEDLQDVRLSRYSTYKNYIHTAEIALRVTRKDFNLNVGFQMVPQTSHFRQDFQGNHTDTTRTVTNFSPTADFRWKISNVSQLRFNYRGTTSQPSMSDLLDITDDSNPLNVKRGNPGLKPAFTQNFRLFYNNYIQNHQRSVMAHLNFSTTSNAVSNMVTYDQTTGGRTTRPENISGNWNTFGMLMFNTALDSAAFFNVNTFTTLRYAHNVGYVSVGQALDSQKSTTRTTTLSERLSGSFRNDWLELELNGSLEYMHARSALQENNNLDTWTFSYGANVMLTAPWGTQLSTGMNMNSRRGYSDASMNTNELIWNAQLSHSLLQGNALTLSLQFYDILHQQSNFSRTISAMQRSDTEYNAITSYAMLHVIYRLNLFGGMSSMRGPRGEGPDGRRGGFGGGPGGPGGPGGRPGGGPGFGGGRPRF